jgi:hypothetical protein
LGNILAEIIKQSKVKFSYEDDYDIDEYKDIENEESQGNYGTVFAGMRRVL